MMQADAVAQPLAHVGAVGAGELEAGDPRRDLGLLFLRADLQAGEVLRAARGVGLREVHHVGRRLAFVDQFLDGVRERNLGVGIVERHRALAGLDGEGRAAIQLRHRLFEEPRVAERGRHQQEAGLRHGEERHLPGAAAVAVRVVMELVHHHIVHCGIRSLAQRHVRQDFGRAAEDRRIVVHAAVAGRQPDQVGTELAAQRHPLLVDQRLDWARVDRTLAARERREEERRSDERLAGTGRRVEDDVLAVEQFENRLFLRRVEREVLRGGVLQEVVEQPIAGGIPLGVVQKVDERGGSGHCPSVVPRITRQRYPACPASAGPPVPNCQTDPPLMSEQVVVITGASTGIGAVLAQQLAREGMSVVLVARRAEAVAAVIAAVIASRTPDGARLLQLGRRRPGRLRPRPVPGCGRRHRRVA